MSNVSSSNSQGVRVPKLRFPGFEGEWESSLLGEVGTFTKGAPLSKADISEEGTPFILYGELYTTYNEVTTAIVRKTDKEVDSSQYSRIGDVIIPTSGETPEEIATATCVMLPNVILAGDLNIFRGSKIDGRIISYIINHIVNQDISRIAQGKSVVHIKADELSKIRINYPNSEEQKKLIRFLEILSARIDKQRQLVEALKSYKRGALSKLFPKNGENTPEYRFAGFTNPWKQQKIIDIADRFDNLRIPVASNLRIAGTTPYYGANGIQDYVDGFTHNGEFVLVAEDGANDLQNYPVRCVQGKIWVNNHAHVLQGKQGICDNSFLSYSISQADIESLLVGGGRAKLNADTMMNIELYLPNIKEQIVIGNFITNLDCLIVTHQHRYDKLQRLKYGLLQQLFI